MTGRPQAALALNIHRQEREAAHLILGLEQLSQGDTMVLCICISQSVVRVLVSYRHEQLS